MSENIGAHVAVELHHVIVTDRRLNKITASCPRRILNVYLMKLHSRTRCVGNHNKERMTVVLVMCNARKTAEEQNRIPDEKRN